MSIETNETSVPKKSILTRAMEAVAAKEKGEVTEETAAKKQLIKKIAVGASAVVAGTLALTLVLKHIAAEVEESDVEEAETEESTEETE